MHFEHIFYTVQTPNSIQIYIITTLLKLMQAYTVHIRLGPPMTFILSRFVVLQKVETGIDVTDDDDVLTAFYLSWENGHI